MAYTSLMTIIIVAATDPINHYHEHSYIAHSLEVCFDMLTAMVRQGWQLQVVKLADELNPCLDIPTEAFDNQSVTDQLKKLELEWQTILTG